MKINEVYLKGQDQVSGWNDPNKIIIHHPEFNGSVQELNDVMRNMGYAMIGYNYYVRKDGTVWKGRPDNVTSANCYGQNNHSLGVCFEGDYNKDKDMPKAQFNAGVELIKYLKSKYKISEVNGHKHYYNTDCPGKNFPLSRMLSAVKSNDSSTNHSSELVSQHGKCIVIVDKLNIREKPSTSSRVVGSYLRGESVYYDYYVDNEGYRWISWVGASGKRRYMAVRILATNKKYGNCV
ncbi:N-acetylmuramoyl-L-alanine amidase [Clostridium baratii]|uniref:N-acetylmuramoyl-L-alanine amidase n=1 Tax=Clostridium baratii TaxID=1561 RepID=A0A174QNP2_9CLOT|nr:N-acetylmuramoyl-L-alanine amidase [Clostridium baratii]CUP72500.1 N-acetylmuramoyl-L-alanine amidase [Clostridium baratii]